MPGAVDPLISSSFTLGEYTASDPATFSGGGEARCTDSALYRSEYLASETR